MTAKSGKRVFIVGGDAGVSTMFNTKGWSLVDSPDDEDLDLVVFTGGDDVSPFLYGERVMKGTFCNVDRDRKEIKLLKNLPAGIAKLGICRGGQFLNVMCGGSMFQDVNGHAIRGMHDIKCLASGEIIRVTSTHHQMMIPAEDSWLVACAKEATRKTCEGKDITYTQSGREKDWDDCEVVYYNAFNALCFQPHPEYVEPDHPCQEYFWRTLDLYCFQ